MTLTPSELAELRRRDRVEHLVRMLEIATDRLEVCIGRMRACEEERPGAHAVSLIEGPGWLTEQRTAIAEGKRALEEASRPSGD